MASTTTVQALREKINNVFADRAILHDAGQLEGGGVLKTGWPKIDAVLGGGLLAGALHEWFGPAVHESRGKSPWKWSPPICVLVHLAWQALNGSAQPQWTVWIGGRCFPYPSVLVRSRGTDRRLLERSLFVTACEAASRLWAFDLALQSPAVGFVVADGTAFSMAATRRIQLLARKHQTPALLVRPPWEMGELSSAQSRWLIQRERSNPSGTNAFCNPRWRTQLLRCKKVQFEADRCVWLLEWDRDTSTLNLSSEMVRQACDAKDEQAYGGSYGVYRSA